MHYDYPYHPDVDYDPVTGAPLPRSRRTSGTYVATPIAVPTVGVAPASPYAYVRSFQSPIFSAYFSYNRVLKFSFPLALISHHRNFHLLN